MDACFQAQSPIHVSTCIVKNFTVSLRYQTTLLCRNGTATMYQLNSPLLLLTPVEYEIFTYQVGQPPQFAK